MTLIHTPLAHRHRSAAGFTLLFCLITDRKWWKHTIWRVSSLLCEHTDKLNCYNTAAAVVGCVLEKSECVSASDGKCTKRREFIGF